METLKLSSSRLQLTPFPTDEIKLFHQMNSAPFVRQYLWDDEIISIELAEQILVQNTQHFQEDKFGLWKITTKTTGEFVGYAGLWFFFEEVQPQLIYALNEPSAGNGYATEAARLIIQYAFEQLQFDYLVAATDAPHKASQAVATRLGMVKTSTESKEGKATVFFRLEKNKT